MEVMLERAEEKAPEAKKMAEEVKAKVEEVKEEVTGAVEGAKAKVHGKKGKSWRTLTPAQRGRAVLAGIVQAALTIAVLVDLRKRSAEQLNGKKWVWRMLAFVNYIGPASYFLFARKK